MTELKFRYHHKNDRGTVLYSYGNESEALFFGIKIHNNKLIMFNAVQTDKKIDHEKIIAFQEYLNLQLAEAKTMGIIPIIPAVHSATLESNGKFVIHESSVN
jgi:hypothetical protein